MCVCLYIYISERVHVYDMSLPMVLRYDSTAVARLRGIFSNPCINHLSVQVSNCFICGLPRDSFEKAKGFQDHVTKDHNVSDPAVVFQYMSLLPCDPAFNEGLCDTGVCTSVKLTLMNSIIKKRRQIPP